MRRIFAHMCAMVNIRGGEGSSINISGGGGGGGLSFTTIWLNPSGYSSPCFVLRWGCETGAFSSPLFLWGWGYVICVYAVVQVVVYIVVSCYCLFDWMFTCLLSNAHPFTYLLDIWAVVRVKIKQVDTGCLICCPSTCHLHVITHLGLISIDTKMCNTLKATSWRACHWLIPDGNYIIE